MAALKGQEEALAKGIDALNAERASRDKEVADLSARLGSTLREVETATQQRTEVEARVRDAEIKLRQVQADQTSGESSVTALRIGWDLIRSRS